MITVVIVTYQVPLTKVVKSIASFSGDNAVKNATDFINEEATKWLKETIGGGNPNAAKMEDYSYDPITELGYDVAEYQLWEGECGFEAILDEVSQKALDAAHYKREFTDKGLPLPGYLRAAMGEDVTDEVAEVHAFYAGPKH